jgi:hypothetical protein
MQPAIKVGGRPVKQKKLRVRHTLPCGTRLIFDESLLERSYLPLMNEMEVESEDEAPAATAAKSATVDTKSAVTTAPVQSTGEMAVIVQKLSTGEVKAIGGGARKGFGTITAPAVPPVPLTKPASALSQEESAGNGNNGKGGRKEVHCCIEENEQFIPSYLLDEEESEDDEPCVTEADLQEEALERERARARDVFERMLSGELPPTKDKKTLRKEALEKEKEKKKVGFAEEKNVEHEIAAEEEVAPARSAEAQETLDILNELKNAANAKPVPVATTKAPSSTSKTDVSKGKSVSESPAQATAAESAEEEAENVQTTKDGYAKMHQLKNIFYREVRRPHSWLQTVYPGLSYHFSSDTF